MAKRDELTDPWEQLQELEAAHDTTEAMLQIIRQQAPSDTRIRADVFRALRLACGEIGDNDWADDLHPADVIEKHLVRPAEARIDALERENAALRALLERIQPYMKTVARNSIDDECGPLYDELKAALAAAPEE